MTKVYRTLCLVTLVGFLGCQATRYQQQGPSGPGGYGYSDRQVLEDIFSIKFYANRSPSPSTLQNFLYRRAAEITLKNGYSHFTVLRGPRRPRGSYDWEPHPEYDDYYRQKVGFSLASPNRIQMMIKCFKEGQSIQDEDLVNAEDYLSAEVQPSGVEAN